MSENRTYNRCVSTLSVQNTHSFDIHYANYKVYLRACVPTQLLSEAVERELESVRPTHVINAAGVTGRPNVDWCESNKDETVRTNVVGTLTIADACNSRGAYIQEYLRC